MLDGPAMTAHKQLAAKRKDFAELEAQISSLDDEIAAQKQAQEIFAELLMDADGHPVDHSLCPTCTQEISPEFIGAKIAAHKQSQQGLEADKADLEAKRSELGDIAGAEAVLKRQEEKMQQKLAWVQTVTAATERITFIENAVKDLEAALAAAKAAEASPVDTSALDALTKEIGEWEGRLAPAVQYESTLKQIEQATARYEEQNLAVNELETLCAHFGKDGIKAKLIKEHIGAFGETVNTVLSKWGYTACLSIEPYSFEVMTPKTAPRYLPLKELSGFERLAFGVALQCAIAVHSKLRMILVDRADTMIDAQRNRLLGCIKLMLDEGMLDQAIVMIAEKSKDVPQKPGTQFYFIEDGTIERL